jgi:hypothetical protein
MATSAGTTPTDVRVEIDTILDDTEISNLLDRVERDIDREYDASSGVTFKDTDHRKNFEATLTALRIAEGRDRRAESAQSGRTSTEYETSTIENLRARVRRLDPADAFGYSGSIIRDGDRHVSTTTDS